MEHQEYVFRFMSVRTGNLQYKSERAPRHLPVYEPDRRTKLSNDLQKAWRTGASAADVVRLASAWQATGAYVARLHDLPFDVERGLDWLTANANAAIATTDLAAAFAALYGAPVGALVSSPPFLESLDRVSDAIVAEALHRTWKEPTDPLSAARKLLALLRWTSQGTKPPGDTLAAALAAITIAIPDYVALPRTPPDRPAPPPGDGKDADVERKRAQLANLKAAHQELSRAVADPKALVARRAPVLAAAATNSRTRVAARSASARVSARTRPAPQLGGPEHEFAGANLRYTEAAAAALSAGTHAVLRELRLDVTSRDPANLASVLEDHMQTLSGELAASQKPTTILELGGVLLDAQLLHTTLFGPGLLPGPALLQHCNFQAGIGDLLIVKQTLKAYELAEFAHVENVLAGEAREREHRRLNLREETDTSETETEREKERNLESTERNEMQAEADKTVKSQFQLDAGLQVSGSYGPAVSFTASLNAGFSTSTEESQRKSVAYSKEVTDKTSERVRERVRKETRVRVLEQIEEVNRHSITNVPATNGHIRGIYRWLNKVYDAQILNYGQRMMYEFVVPEPAAYLLYSLIENPPPDAELVKPEPPTWFGAPLKPSHIDRTNYLDWVAKYQVRNVPAPPPEFLHVTTFDKQDKVDGGTSFGRATTVEVPEGYEAYGATVMTDFSHGKDDTNYLYHVIVAGVPFNATGYWGGHYSPLPTRVKQVGIAYELIHVWSFALSVEIHCRLGAEGRAKWQQQVYDSITEAYLRQKSAYDEKVAAKKIQQGVQVLGRNPLENQRLIREELKKLVLMMLTGGTGIARNSMQSTTEPAIDVLAACDNGSFIRFFENAFEWNNMLYVLYPYFWGRKARWVPALQFTDPDLDFAAFLRAGAARVQLPVRPGFESAVAHFCQFGDIWEGNDPPLRDDALYVPIVDEIAANLGKLDEGVPWPAGAQSWEVRIPTSLVLVQNLEEIPGIRDVLTGQTVVITS